VTQNIGDAMRHLQHFCSYLCRTRARLGLGDDFVRDVEFASGEHVEMMAALDRRGGGSDAR